MKTYFETYGIFSAILDVLDDLNLEDCSRHLISMSSPPSILPASSPPRKISATPGVRMKTE